MDGFHADIATPLAPRNEKPWEGLSPEDEAEDALPSSMLSVEGPVWLPIQSPVHSLLPTASQASPRIAFLGSTAESAQDGPGHLSRALPLFLAEHTYFGACARTCTLVPWLEPPHAGFCLSGFPWSDEEAAAYGRQGQPLMEYVVTTHIRAQTSPWGIEVRIVRTRDACCLGTAQGTFPLDQAQTDLPHLAEELLHLLNRQAGVALVQPPPFYQVPAGGGFMVYLLRLDQLLAIRCSGIEETPGAYLSGERGILDGNLQLCLDHPLNPTSRILLLQSCLSMKRVRPGIVADYLEKLERLQSEHPIPEPMEGAAQRLLAELMMP